MISDLSNLANGSAHLTLFSFWDGSHPACNWSVDPPEDVVDGTDDAPAPPVSLDAAVDREAAARSGAAALGSEPAEVPRLVSRTGTAPVLEDGAAAARGAVRELRVEPTFRGIFIWMHYLSILMMHSNRSSAGPGSQCGLRAGAAKGPQRASA
jgi:hypothetical protein